MNKRRVSRHEVTQPRNESYRLLPLTRNQNAIVDTADFEWLSQWNWFAHWSKANKSFYASRHDGPRYVAMHKVIFGPNCDHKNRNTLDNRRKNLRECTKQQNCQNRKRFSNNTSGFKGVVKNYEKWQSVIQVNGKRFSLGRFKTKEAAAIAYDIAAIKVHRQFAVLNFPKN